MKEDAEISVTQPCQHTSPHSGFTSVSLLFCVAGSKSLVDFGSSLWGAFVFLPSYICAILNTDVFWHFDTSLSSSERHYSREPLQKTRQSDSIQTLEEAKQRPDAAFCRRCSWLSSAVVGYGHILKILQIYRKKDEALEPDSEL